MDLNGSRSFTDIDKKNPKNIAYLVSYLVKIVRHLYKEPLINYHYHQYLHRAGSSLKILIFNSSYQKIVRTKL